MAEPEPMPVCEQHGERIAMRMPGGHCSLCGRSTNGTWVMCGYCAEERMVCVFHGTPAVRVLHR